MQKILIYGFGKYFTYSNNITEEILKRFPRSAGVSTHIFEVKFDREMFLKKISQVKPDIVIGLGQMPAKRRRKMRIERKAYNIQAAREFPNREPKTISRTGAEHRFVNLKLPKTKQTVINYNAGRYVCNYSMYVISEYMEDRGGKFAFIHIPLDYEIELALSYLSGLVKQLKKQP